jgi:hypothetical protein
MLQTFNPNHSNIQSQVHIQPIVNKQLQPQQSVHQNKNHFQRPFSHEPVRKGIEVSSNFSKQTLSPAPSLNLTSQVPRKRSSYYKSYEMSRNRSVPNLTSPQPINPTPPQHIKFGSNPAQSPWTHSPHINNSRPYTPQSSLTPISIHPSTKVKFNNGSNFTRPVSADTHANRYQNHIQNTKMSSS